MSSARIRRATVSGGLALALALGGALLVPASASATTVTVTSSADSGGGSLRDVVAASSPGDVIEFDPSVSSIVLESHILIPHALTILGPGADALTIIRSGASVLRALLVFEPTSPGQDLAVSGVSFVGLDNGDSAIITSDLAGSPGRDLTLSEVDVRGFGGSGVHLGALSGSVLIEDSVFVDNQGAQGGGAWLGDILGETAIKRTEFRENTADSLGGGLALSDLAAVTIADSLFEDNVVDNGTGGGIGAGSLDDGLVIMRTVFRGNVIESDDLQEVFGSAISVEETSAPLVLEAASVIGNSGSSQDGYGIMGAVAVGTILANGLLLVGSSTFADNSISDADEGFDGSVGLGVEAVEAGAQVDIVNSTFRESVEQSEENAGYAVLVWTSDGDVTIRHSTLEATLSLVTAFVSGPVRVENSILTRGVVLPDDPSDFPNIGASGPFDVSHNVFTGPNAPSIYNDLGGNQFRVDPLLGPLRDNGGPTLTMVPGAGSPAIDAGSVGTVFPAFDQRGSGFPRVLAGRIDVGAVETPAVLAVTGQTISGWVPIGAGVLLLGGIVAIAATGIRRRADYMASPR